MRPRPRPYLVAPLVISLAVPGADLLAQRRAARAERDRHQWLDDCRERHGDRRSEVFCDLREAGWRSRPGQSLRVDASPNGGIDVSAWDRDSVHVVVKIGSRAPTEAEARERAGRIEITMQGGDIRASGPPSRRSASWWVSYEIYAPTRTDLTLETHNGPVAVDGVVGRMDLRAVNGPMSLEGVGGEVRARTQNGPLHVELLGTRWEGPGLDAETQNGPLVLEVPEDYSARLETGTVNGPMDLGFPIMVQGRFGGVGRRRITTELGRGGATIRAVTTNGPAVIRRN